MANNTNVTSSSSSIGFFSLLTIVFIVLKLCGIITWSWWWILSPIWGPAALFIICILIFYIVLKFTN